MLALACAGFDASTGRPVVARRPIESSIAIPAGAFTMGGSREAQAAAIALCREEISPLHEKFCPADAWASETPERRVYLSGFQIDRVEVTVAAYRGCVQAGACSPLPLVEPDPRFLAPRVPLTRVTWAEAARYCAFSGGRLPSEAEWERTARGRDARTWPWGNVPRTDMLNHGKYVIVNELGPMPAPLFQADASDGHAFVAGVGSYPAGASPEGALDMAGNVMEWTADLYHEDPPQRRASVNPRGPREGDRRVVRGGSWRQPRVYHRTTARDAFPPDLRSPEIGFRCAR